MRSDGPAANAARVCLKFLTGNVTGQPLWSAGAGLQECLLTVLSGDTHRLINARVPGDKTQVPSDATAAQLRDELILVQKTLCTTHEGGMSDKSLEWVASVVRRNDALRLAVQNSAALGRMRSGA